MQLSLWPGVGGIGGGCLLVSMPVNEKTKRIPKSGALSFTGCNVMNKNCDIGFIAENEIKTIIMKQGKKHQELKLCSFYDKTL